MPVLDLIWVMLVAFLFVAWIVVVIYVVADALLSHDLSALAKAGWVLFVIVIPWLGVIVYLIARGDSLAERFRGTFGGRYSREPWVRGVPVGGRPVDAGSRSYGSLSRL